MCGFVCLWNFGDKALASTMIERIKHRGPDATSIVQLADAPVIMAHCRLSIVGPDDGRQPILDHADGLVVNGEIYNNLELRSILGKWRFASQSDSETVLHLFRTKKGRWIDRLDGMFSFVLASDGSIIAGRDPLGIKPLYVAAASDGLAFASELKAFDGLGFDSVESIPPGSLFDSRYGMRQWYRLPQGAAQSDPSLDIDATAQELRLVLEAAVEKWMVADVEVASFLSGGLDSSIIAAIAQQIRKRDGISPLRTFAVGTKGSSDLISAAKVANYIGSDHKEYIIEADDIVENLSHVIYHLESSDVDLVRSAIPTLFAARLARRDVKAVLTGEGADELFGGYSYHHAYADHPRALADELTRSLSAMHNINLQRVDRITMAESLEARTPFLDKDLIAFAQAIPADLKLRKTDANAAESTGSTTEKWILRKACADLLPDEVVWRKKAQFDEGSGTLGVLQQALEILAAGGEQGDEAAIYEKLLRACFADPELVLANAGTWSSGRVAA